ncbi:MAG TPA: TIGR03619 family F420-dependent LLM class oxidoreductase [Acidimicrobiales bacterium]|nr:TIGR03619 family F420-dependent LLM class oxidoreductase [Acidimicrobiales bacterium]
MLKLGVPLGRVNPRWFVEVAKAADRLGYESVWLPEHLVLPVEMSRSPYPGEEHPPVPPETPVFDALAYLSFLAGVTSHVRLGTHVYNLGLRHPFVAARGVQTLDIVSGGRAIFGIGAGWLESEWQAVGLDFHRRGRRLDEALSVCKRLWSEEVVEHHGEHFDFGPVRFEPKPLQRPWPPILVGGESTAALARAARSAEGWIGMNHTPESAARAARSLAELARRHGRERPEVTVGGPLRSAEELVDWQEAGVDRLIVAPWRRSAEAVDGLEALAQALRLRPPG